jgi:hypothetical protein
MPQWPAGKRRLPARSVPSPIAEPLSANSAASPPELPPLECAVEYGLVVRPQSGFTHSKDINACLPGFEYPSYAWKKRICSRDVGFHEGDGAGRDEKLDCLYERISDAD